MTELLDDLAHVLAADPSVLFVTGAGVSADSGLPTYRGIGGLYEGQSADEGIPIEQALSGTMFRRKPDLTWKYLRQLEQACRGAKPNRAHRVIASLEQRLSRVVVLTQNVDGLHFDAGSKEVIEIHGSLRKLRCTFCGWTDQVRDYAHFADGTPECPACGSVIRPRIVLFEESLPSHGIERLEAELDRGFDLVFSVGTTSVFPYIAEPIHRANRAGGLTIEINPGDSEVSQAVKFRIQAGAAATLGRLGDRLGL